MNTLVPNHSTGCRQRGVVLPIALIMLVIISFAGLLAARSSVTHEQFSNNMRTNQVARQMAEEALRYCERVAMDDALDAPPVFNKENGNVQAAEIASESVNDVKAGLWNKQANWGDDKIVIKVTPNYGANASKKTPNNPRCIIQKLKTDRYLVTARGFSADAVIDAGVLKSGSEVWLQSTLTPCIPLKSDNNGLGSGSCS